MNKISWNQFLDIYQNYRIEDIVDNLIGWLFLKNNTYLHEWTKLLSIKGTKNINKERLLIFLENKVNQK